MSAWPLPDPSPEEDLPSDSEFGGWLESLDPVIVEHDREKGFHGSEYYTLTYMRRKVLKSQSTSD